MQSSVNLTIAILALSLLAASNSVRATENPDARQEGAVPNSATTDGIKPTFPDEQTLKKFAAFDKLSDPGYTTIAPLPTIDTLLQDRGGWRSRLAEHDIGVNMTWVTTGMAQLNSTGQPRNPQMYNGQRPTISTQSLDVGVNFGLAKWGLPNATINVGALYYLTTFQNGNSPNMVQFRSLFYYQSFLNDKVELKVGWINNYYEYVGLFMGGSPMLANGLSALIPIALGMSTELGPAPAANFTFKGRQDGYVRMGVQRSISTDGPVAEARSNGSGLEFSQPGTRALYIGEIGLKRDASKDSHQIWLRTGYMNNRSRYLNYATGGRNANHGGYAAGDYQITQPDSLMPFRGTYIGATASWAPSELNVYTRSYEARLYLIGLLPSRPTDAITFRTYYNKFSPEARRAVSREGIHTSASQTAFEVGYAWHIRPGIHLLPAVSYLKNPSFTGNFNNAFLFSLNLYIGL